MSLEPGQPAEGGREARAGRPAETGTLAEPGAASAGTAPAEHDPAGEPDTDEYDPAEPRPAEPRPAEPGLAPEPGLPTEPGASDTPGAEGAAPVAAPDQPSGTGALAGPPPAGERPEESAGDLDAPLLADVADLRASWHQIQAGFVDDPREAVGDAANLVEHTVQALAGALQQRQRLLRAMWDRGHSTGGLGASASGSAEVADASAGTQPAPDDVPDTERLRQVMQRYRILFNEICQP